MNGFEVSTESGLNAMLDLTEAVSDPFCVLDSGPPTDLFVSGAVDKNESDTDRLFPM